MLQRHLWACAEHHRGNPKDAQKQGFVLNQRVLALGSVLMLLFGMLRKEANPSVSGVCVLCFLTYRLPAPLS